MTKEHYFNEINKYSEIMNNDNIIATNIKGVLRISLPLILSLSSAALMSTADRMFLGHYDLNLYSAVCLMMTFYFIIELFGAGISAISEIFVGQFNGSRQLNKVSIPTWQMIYFSLLTIPLTVIIGIYGTDFILPKEAFIANSYFKITVSFIFLTFISTAIHGFFIGIGKTKIVLWSTILPTILNIILDPFLIYGSDKLFTDLLQNYHLKNTLFYYLVKTLNIPELGVSGAAIATVISQFASVIILTIIFTSSKYNKKYNVLKNWAFNKNIFFHCLKIGLPTSLGYTTEVSAIYFLQTILIKKSFAHMTVMSITTAMFPLFGFIYEGMMKACSTIAANIMGANQTSKLTKLIKSSMKIHIVLMLFVFAVLYLFPYKIIAIFIDIEKIDPTIIEHIKIALYGVVIYMMIEGISWIISGILTAGGDVVFTMLVNSLSAWLFIALPIYIALTYYDIGPSTAWKGLTLIHPTICAILYYLRYKFSNWQKLDLRNA